MVYKKIENIKADCTCVRAVQLNLLTYKHVYTYVSEKVDGTPLQCSCLENPMDGGTWWGREESDATERLPFHFSLSCIGEGNGKCLENPEDGGAWWAAVYGVTQSRTRLK